MTLADPQNLDYDSKIADLTGKLDSAKKVVAELETELDWWQRGRDLYGSSGANGSGVRSEALKPTLAQAIIRVLGEGDAALSTRAVMDALRSRGWMPNGTTAEHNVRSKLAQLARGPNARLQRVEHGVYALRELPEEGS